MTVRDLILQLLDHPMNAEVVRSAGEDPEANVDVRTVRMGTSYGGWDGKRVAVILE